MMPARISRLMPPAVLCIDFLSQADVGDSR